MLPFTAEVFLSVFEHYNRAIWPAQVIALGLGLAAVLSALRPVPGSARLTAAPLAAAWVWTGVAYHLMSLAVIDFAAPLYGGLFVLQGLLLAWSGVVRERLAFRFRADAFGWAGLGLVAYATAVSPLIDRLAGHGWQGAAIVGLTPGPTTVFTIGLLLLARARTPRYLLVIPALWSFKAGATAWVLGLPHDLASPVAALAGAGLVLWKGRRRAQS